MSMHNVLKVAESQLGVTEFPKDSNKVIYNTEYYGYEASGVYFPWCVTFLWWVFQHGGDPMAFFNSGKTASCTALKNLYSAEGRWVTSEYQRGDIVLMNFSGGQDPEHCGIVVDTRNGYLVTIEGNTSPGIEGSQNNGGCVAKKYRYERNIIGACRPRYSTEETPTKKDYEGHWAEADIEWANQNSLTIGFPNGEFRPDEPLTRAEASTIIRRLYDLLKKES